MKKDAEKYFLHIKEISKAPVVKTSALTGEGIEELIKELVKLKKKMTKSCTL